MSLFMGIYKRQFILLSVSLLIFTLSSVNADDVPEDKKLQVKIYYEALCPDSIRFIRNQLWPTMIQKNRLNSTDLKFVPFGHVVYYNDRYTNEKVMQCQHGRKECELNAQHACVIENNSEREAFDMITCMMSGYNKPIEKCGERFGINLNAARACKGSRSNVDILEKYGKDTYSLNPSFVPAISFENVYDWDEQTEILEDFDAIFCRKYEKKFNMKLNGC